MVINIKLATDHLRVDLNVAVHRLASFLLVSDEVDYLVVRTGLRFITKSRILLQLLVHEFFPSTFLVPNEASIVMNLATVCVYKRVSG